MQTVERLSELKERFENLWLLHSDFKEGFSVWWRDFWSERWEGYKFMKKLPFVKSKLKEWNKVSFGELKDRKKNILANIASIDAIE